MTVTCVDFQQGIGNGAEAPLGSYVTTSHLQVGDTVVLYETPFAGGGGEFNYNQTTGGTVNIVTHPFGSSFSANPTPGHGFGGGDVGSLSWYTINADCLVGNGTGDGVLAKTGFNNGLGSFFGATIAMWTFRGGVASSGVLNDVGGGTGTDDDAIPWTDTLTAPALTAYQVRFCVIVGRSGWTQAGPVGAELETNMSPIGVSRLTTDTDPYALWNAGYGANTSTQSHRVTWTPYGAAEELTSVEVGVNLPGWVYATHGPLYRHAKLSTLTFASPVTPVAEPQAVVPLYTPRRVNPAELPYQVSSGMVKRK